MNRNSAQSNLSTDLTDNRLSLLEQSPLQSNLQTAIASRSSSQATTNLSNFDGSGGQKTFTIPRGSGNTIINNFGGLGARDKQTPAVLAELDTLKFEGAGLIAKNLTLTQQGQDLVISFEQVPNIQVTLKAFALENLDNFGPSPELGLNAPGNILFEGNTIIQDSFDVFDASWQRRQILNGLGLNRVTFLNDLNNQTKGFDRSDDVINGQGGDDILYGLSGDDVLRGDAGDDKLWGNAGNDTLWGGLGRDTLVGGSGRDIFALKPNQGADTIVDFDLGERDRIGLAGGLTFDQLLLSQGTGVYANNTLISTKAGNLLAIVNGVAANLLNHSAFLTLADIGTVTSQGVQAMRVDVARDHFRVDGTGITIGVMSDSFNNLGGATQDSNSGDLPASFGILKDLPGGGTDEGRAMMQLIHDVAPGAKLLFRTGLPDRVSFAKGVQELVNAGANIIVDDLIYPNEPMFQDGFLAQIVNQAVAKGVAYFTAAGNSARDSYESPFQSTAFYPGYGEVHDFDPGTGVDIYQSVTIPVDERPLQISFQWDSPLDLSPNDLNIYLLDQTSSRILAQSTTSNIGSDPIEVLRFLNDGSYGSNNFNLLIAKGQGSAPGLMKYIAVNREAFEINEYNTDSSTVFGHQNATGVATVGAVSYFDPTRLESFSSLGGTKILFDQSGDRLSRPESRPQPRFVAPNETNTTFFGKDILEDADSFPNFQGTSAAAPHAAAVAALMLQANAQLRPADVYKALERTALDINDPNNPGSGVGFDDASGYGLIQVDRAIAKVV
ncbi:S8 family serine peptidase [Phormidesmis priestleyi]